jgi:putative tryptophan/tyrosine transport system substrate-binding protein
MSDQFLYRRREFITLFGGAAAAWPLAARAQQPQRMRRIGVLMDATADDAESQVRLAAFLQSLRSLDWIDGRNVRIDIRWSAGNADDIRKYAMELVALAPDAILAGTGGTVPALQQATRTVPIVFAQTIDPVGGGFVKSLARPGGNTTGFTQFEYTLAGKWPELLKQVAPAVTRAAVLRSPITAAGIGQWAVAQAAAASIGMELTPIAVRDPDEIEREIGAFAQGANGGLIQVVGAQANIHRQLVIAQAARHRLPAIYPYRFHVSAGGLISYGPDLVSQYRRAAGYVDRILKGEKPADLPVQTPTKYELVINLKTAKALGLEIPPTLLARADEVIE